MIAHGGDVALMPRHRIRKDRPLEGIHLLGKASTLPLGLSLDQIEVGRHARPARSGRRRCAVRGHCPARRRPSAAGAVRLRQHRRVAVVARGGLQHEVLEQQRDVLAPVAQRRQLDGSPRSGGNRGRRGTSAAGSTRPDRPWSRRRPGHRSGSRWFEPSRSMVRSCSARSSLTWSDSGMLSISSRNSVPPCGVFEPSDPLPAGAGESAGLVAEDLALEHGLRHGAAVERDEAVVAAAGELVQAAGDQFLAGAGLAADQHVGRGVGHLKDQRAGPPGSRRTGRAASRSMPSRSLSLRRSVSTSSVRLRRFRARAAPTSTRRSGGERLLDEIVGARRASPRPPWRCRRGRSSTTTGSFGIDLACACCSSASPSMPGSRTSVTMTPGNSG